MEYADFSIKLPSKTIHLSLIYRPPDGSVLQFCQELTTYLEQNINTTGNTLLMGDLNIHINDPKDQDNIIFEDTIGSLGLQNHVSFPTTDFKTHWIQSLLLKTQTLSQTLIKAHYFQTTILSTIHKQHHLNLLSSKEYLTGRSNISTLTTWKLKSTKPYLLTMITAHQASLSTTTIGHSPRLLNKLAPVKGKTVSDKPKLPWFEW